MATSDFVHAMQAGSAAGLAQRQADISEREMADKLRYNYFALAAQQAEAQARIDAHRAAATAERSHEQSLLTQRLAQHAEEQAASRALHEKQQSALDLYREGELKNQERTIGLHEQRNKALLDQGAANILPQTTNVGGVDLIYNPKSGHFMQSNKPVKEATISPAQAFTFKRKADAILSDSYTDPEQKAQAKKESDFWNKHIKKNFPSLDYNGDGRTSLSQSATKSSSQEPVKIETDEDYQALESGTRFIGPDGKIRRKP